MSGREKGAELMEQAAITLKYDGFIAGEGEMDAREAAEAIKGFADFSRRVGEALYGKAHVKSTIRGVHHGSVEFDFLLRFLTEGAGLLASIAGPAKELLKILPEILKVLQHLKGQPPASVKKADNGSVFVENNSGQIINVSNLTLNLALDPETSRAVQKFVRKPLQGSAEKVKVLVDRQEIANVNQEEAKFFVPIEAGEVLAENTNDVYVTVGTAVLDGTNTKWRFHDGTRKFPAVIEDAEFLNQVGHGEVRFGKGDVMYVRMRTTQKRVGRGLRSEHVIEEVLDHRPAAFGQARLL